MSIASQSILRALIGCCAGVSALLLPVQGAVPDSLTLSDYCSRVSAYSYTLKMAAEKVSSAEAFQQQTHTAFLPQLNATGDFSVNFKNRYGTLHGESHLLQPYSFALQPSFVQNIYQGHTQRTTYAQALLQSDMARSSEESARLEVSYLAEYNYWNLASTDALRQITSRYEAVVRSMYSIVRTRFEDGYVAKNDLLMIETRLREAEYNYVQADNLHRVALQNFNILMGESPSAAYTAIDSVTVVVPLPPYLTAEEAQTKRPDYRAASQQIEYDRYGVRLVSGRYLPQLSAGVEGVWRNPTPNFGGGDLDGVLFLRLSVPIFHWGERRYALASSQATLRSSEYARSQLSDQITQQVSEAWTNLMQAAMQIRIAEAALSVARENMSLNTFSYQEGVLSILDVISSQLTWLQAYTNIVTAHFNQKVAIAAYRKAVGDGTPIR